MKTNRRDAEKSGTVLPGRRTDTVWVRTRRMKHCGIWCRARGAARKDQLKARHRLGNFLLRHGKRPEGMKAWTKQHLEWIGNHVHFDQPAMEVTLQDYLDEVKHVPAPA